MKKNLVIVIDSSFPSSSGGKENWLYEMSKRLQDRYNLTIISQKSKKQSFYPISEIKVDLVTLPAISFNLTEAFSLFFRHVSFGLISMAYVFYKFRFKKEKTIVITMSSGPVYFPAWIMRGRNFRRVHAARGSVYLWMTDRSPSFSGLWKFLYNSFTLKDAHLTLANGYDTYEEMIQFSNKVKVLPNGVDFNKYSHVKIKQMQDIPIIVSIAGLRPPDDDHDILKKDIKGIAHLIKSIPFIKTNYSGDFKVVFAGAGNKEPFIRLAKKEGVENYVEFLGERKDIPILLCQSKISATLSNPYTGGGGMSMATLESMAAGKSIIAWDNNTYRQLITHEKTGLLVPPGDFKALGEGIAYLLNNREHADELGKNAQEDAREYDFDTLSEKLSKMLDDLFE